MAVPTEPHRQRWENISAEKSKPLSKLWCTVNYLSHDARNQDQQADISDAIQLCLVIMLMGSLCFKPYSSLVLWYHWRPRLLPPLRRHRTSNNSSSFPQAHSQVIRTISNHKHLYSGKFLFIHFSLFRLQRRIFLGLWHTHARAHNHNKMVKFA